MSAAVAAETPVPPAKPVPSAAAGGKPATGTGQRFGSWVLACPSPEQAKAGCVLIQQVSEALSRKVVFVWLVQYNDKGQLLGAFRLPSGVFVNRGLIMKADGKGDGLKVDYTRCDPSECQAVFSITNDVAKQLSGAKTVTVAIALTSGKTADVELNMEGFAGALAALSAKAKGKGQ
jgi:invasion protein IalB